MILDLEKFDKFVESNGDEAPAILWEDASTFNPASLPSDEPRPAGAARSGLSNSELPNGKDLADVIGK